MLFTISCSLLKIVCIALNGLLEGHTEEFAYIMGSGWLLFEEHFTNFKLFQTEKNINVLNNSMYRVERGACNISSLYTTFLL